MGLGASRDFKKESFWRKLLQAHGRSKLGVRAFCRQQGQRESAFYWWRSELARRDAASGRGRRGPSSALVPVRVIPDAAESVPGLEIVLARGRSVRVNGPVDRATLADVLAVLEERGC
jgi:hypothetical protein